MNIKSLTISASLLLLAGCGTNSKKAEQFRALPFPDVLPPAMVDSPVAMTEYMALHWWDGITDISRSYPCDTLLVSGVRVGDVEQKMANWSNLLGVVDMSVVEKSMGRLYERAAACEKKDTSSNVFETFVGLVDKYLYDFNHCIINFTN